MVGVAGLVGWVLVGGARLGRPAVGQNVRIRHEGCRRSLWSFLKPHDSNVLPTVADNVGVVYADPGHFGPPRTGTSASGEQPWADRPPTPAPPTSPRNATSHPPGELVWGLFRFEGVVRGGRTRPAGVAFGLKRTYSPGEDGSFWGL